MYANEICSALKYKLMQTSTSNLDSIFIEEMSINNGASRIDLAHISDLMCGYEIKSDKDNTSRLEHQISNYSRVLDKAILVTGEKLAGIALNLLPEWWGLCIAYRDNEQIQFFEIRKSSINQNISPINLAKLLWRTEALSLLGAYIPSQGFKRVQKHIIYEKIAEIVPLSVIRDIAIYQIKLRRGLRVGERPLLYGGLFQPV